MWLIVSVIVSVLLVAWCILYACVIKVCPLYKLAFYVENLFSTALKSLLLWKTRCKSKQYVLRIWPIDFALDFFDFRKWILWAGWLPPWPPVLPIVAHDTQVKMSVSNQQGRALWLQTKSLIFKYLIWFFLPVGHDLFLEGCENRLEAYTLIYTGEICANG